MTKEETGRPLTSRIQPLSIGTSTWLIEYYLLISTITVNLINIQFSSQVWARLAKYIRLAESPRTNFGCFPCGNKKINNRRGCLLTPLAKLHLPFNTLPRVHKPLLSFFMFSSCKRKDKQVERLLTNSFGQATFAFPDFQYLNALPY